MLSEAKHLTIALVADTRVERSGKILRGSSPSAQLGMTTLYSFVMNPPNENVLVVRRSLLDELGSFHGLNFEPQKYLDAFLSRGNNFFLPRPEAEINPAYKQIIPYALIAFENKVAHYVRGKKAGEQRLVAKVQSASAVT